MAMANSIIKVDSVSFAYNEDLFILEDFSYKVYRGDVITIVGESGCGKSTILNLISKLLEPKIGNISINGDIAYMTQSVTMLPYKTALENSLLACELRGDLSDETIKKSKKMFQDFGLNSQAMQKFPKELSGGMKQRVGLIQTLLIDTDIYLFDEPFNAIDHKTVVKIQDVFFQRIRGNKCAIIVTHDLEQAILYSSRVLILSSTAGKYKEIIFASDFVSLIPTERKKSSLYSEYLYSVINLLGDI